MQYADCLTHKQSNYHLHDLMSARPSLSNYLCGLSGKQLKSLKHVIGCSIPDSCEWKFTI